MKGFTRWFNNIIRPSGHKAFHSCFLLFVAVLLVLHDARLIQATYEQDSPPVWMIVAGYGVAFLCSFALFQSRHTVVRMLFRILFFSVIYTDTLYLVIGNFPFSYPDAINLFNNPGYASGSLATFKMAFLLAFAVAALCFALVLHSVKYFVVPNPWQWVAVFVVMQVVLVAYAKKHPGIHDLLPAPYRVTGNLLAANAFRAEEQWRREKVSVGPGVPRVKHLFLIVDESVSGPDLSINGFSVCTTPFLQKNASLFINFGIACSYANSSAASNLSLLSGMRMDELPDLTYTAFCKPGIFQYAKRAGYQTFLLDAQVNSPVLQNYLTARDLPCIDSLFQPGAMNSSLALHARDSIIAEEAARLASLPVSTFAYVNKAGAHWPYETNFPANLAEDGSLAGGRLQKQASYFKSIYWNVDKFWQRLATKLKHQQGVLIIYTSDHGEDYASGSLKATHATIYKTRPAEGRVPLLAYDRAGFFPAGFLPAVNRYAHPAIFPTLLLSMGYDSTFIRKNWGRTLLDPPPLQPRWFQTGDLFGRGKNQRILIDPLPSSPP